MRVIREKNLEVLMIDTENIFREVWLTMMPKIRNELSQGEIDDLIKVQQYGGSLKMELFYNGSKKIVSDFYYMTKEKREMLNFANYCKMRYLEEK